MTWTSIDTGAPASEPVSVEAVKTDLRITHDAEDAYIGRLIGAARVHAERVTGRLFGSREVRAKADAFPAGMRMPLPFSPVTAIVSVEYVNADGASTTWDSAGYGLHGGDFRPFIAPAYGVSWPSPRRVPEAVTVTATAGYASLPEDAEHAIHLLAAHWYRHRAAVADDGRLSRVPLGTDELLSGVKVWRCA